MMMQNSTTTTSPTQYNNNNVQSIPRPLARANATYRNIPATNRWSMPVVPTYHRQPSTYNNNNHRRSMAIINDNNHSSSSKSLVIRRRHRKSAKNSPFLNHTVDNFYNVLRKTEVDKTVESAKSWANEYEQYRRSVIHSDYTTNTDDWNNNNVMICN
ncbi:8761_t:CDS:1 [Entrophospora sp. SA101]|nr:4059_t:CDS:1 [Entrophospora sp. SA101]CAJ0838008.1 8761_t:CDS:1 [Entrophospora sp. SA101]CAJ0907716.1 5847_t:CDS:1 [Entrophospora sp. SA101]